MFFFFFEYKQRLFKIYSHTNNTLSLSLSLTRSVLLCLSISRVALAQRRRGPFATKYYIIFHSFSVLLHLQPQPFHGRFVLCRIFLRQVLLQSPAFAEQHLQASRRGVVFSVRLQVRGQVFDALGEQGDLYGGRAGIFWGRFELGDVVQGRARVLVLGDNSHDARLAAGGGRGADCGVRDGRDEWMGGERL